MQSSSPSVRKLLSILLLSCVFISCFLIYCVLKGYVQISCVHISYFLISFVHISYFSNIVCSYRVITSCLHTNFVWMMNPPGTRWEIISGVFLRNNQWCISKWCEGCVIMWFPVRHLAQYRRFQYLFSGRVRSSLSHLAVIKDFTCYTILKFHVIWTWTYIMQYIKCHHSSQNQDSDSTSFQPTSNFFFNPTCYFNSFNPSWLLFDFHYQFSNNCLGLNLYSDNHRPWKRIKISAH